MITRRKLTLFHTHHRLVISNIRRCHDTMKQTQKITVQIEGMMCCMCEAHICDSIR